MRWTRLDVTLVVVPLIVAALFIGNRLYGEFRLYRAATQVVEHIESIAGAVETFHDHTGRWFPDGMRVYLSRFTEEPGSYQGIQPEWLYLENNAGMVMELVRYDAIRDRNLPYHLFAEPFQTGEPYMRILLDYGESHREEAVVLSRVHDKLPAKSMSKVNDHLYILDLRRVIDAGI